MSTNGEDTRGSPSCTEDTSEQSTLPDTNLQDQPNSVHDAINTTADQHTKEEAREEAKEEVREETKEEVREETKEEVREEAKEEIREEAKEEVREEAKEEVREEAKEKVREEVKEEVREEAKEEVREEAGVEHSSKDRKDSVSDDSVSDGAHRKDSVSSALSESLVVEQVERGSALFQNIEYLGSSTVDAPVSETEANRKMSILRTQAKECIPIVLVIPPNNGGSIVLKDAAADQPLAAFAVRQILFAARGQVDTELDGCFALNVLHKRSGMYHCHVFHCKAPEMCQQIFDAIGTAFKRKPPMERSPYCNFDIEVTTEIYEDDGKGGFHPVSVDKECFKLHYNSNKKVLVNVTSAPSADGDVLVFEKCFGLSMGVGSSLARNELDQLDNMQVVSKETGCFSIAGYWDTSLPKLAPLNEEATKNHHLTVTADLTIQGMPEPLRFTRELRVRMVKTDTLVTLLSNLATKRKLPVELFVLSLEKVPAKDKTVYKMKQLQKARDTPSPVPHRPKVSEESATPSPSLRKAAALAKVEQTQAEDSDAVDDGEEEDFLVSGWGDEDGGVREDLLKQWRDLLDKWDNFEKWDPKGDKLRPKQLIKLVRKGIPGPLRCQLWQMLSGVDSDPQLMEAYRILITKESPAENVINWDVKRTYVGHEFFQEEGSAGKEALYKISKAYSVYDTEVGYCQGLSFMTAVLLLQKIPEEQAFALLVKIMFNYGHRNMFKTNFQELHLMFFQLDRLLEEYLHDLWEHFKVNSIETHMYASQWFLTIFTAKFPLSVTYQVMDNYLCEGMSVLFQVALALLKLTQRDLLALDFEGILNYFRVSLPRRFGSEEESKLLFNTAYSTKVTQRKLKKLEKDHKVYLEHQASLEDPMVRLERENKQLRDTVLRLQGENDDLAQELVGSKVKLRVEMDKLEERIDTLSKESRANKSAAEASATLIHELREELQEAKSTYQQLMIKLTEERQQHDTAIAEYKKLFQQLDEGHKKESEELSQELLEVKAKLGTDQNHGATALSSEQRLRQVELELAQTKLALVEAQCKNQELEHRIQELDNASAHRGKQSRGLLNRFS